MPMKLNLGKTAVEINVSFAATVTLMLILDESGLCAVGLFCCIIHESGHILCLLLMGEHPKFIKLSFYGIKLERSLLPGSGKLNELAVYASGPAANIILSAVFFIASNAAQGMYKAAVISLGVGIFNLIPCRPLDGGNILFAALVKAMQEENAEKICNAISALMLLPMAFLGVYLCIKNGNFTLIAVTAYLAVVCFLSKKEVDC